MKSKYLLFAIAITVSGLTGIKPVQAAADIDDLIKCSSSSSVYYLAEDGNRYAFPNEGTYFTWYKDFEDVKTISCDDLADLDLAGNVTYQSGTRLLKLQSVPTVYFVEPSGVLRAIQSEDQAEALFGDDWADRVDDLPDAFYPAYELGDDIEDGELPEGLIVSEDDGTLLRIDENEEAVEIEDTFDSDDDEAIFETFAVSVTDLEIKLKIEITISELSSLDHSELTALLELLQTIDVADEFEIEIEIDIEEEGEENNDSEEATEEIEEAVNEIARAEVKIQERSRNGKDTTEADALLISAEELLELAEDSFAAGNYDEAEDYAESSQDYAEDARMGSAVNSIDDDDDDEDDSDEEDSSDEIDEVDEKNDDGEDSEDSTD